MVVIVSFPSTPFTSSGSPALVVVSTTALSASDDGDVPPPFVTVAVTLSSLPSAGRSTATVDLPAVASSTVTVCGYSLPV